MYMHRNMTDEFIGSVASCNIISTGSWYGDLPDDVPNEVKLNRKDYYIEEVQHISIKDTVKVVYSIKWENIIEADEGKIDSVATEEYSISESDRNYILNLIGSRFSDCVFFQEDKADCNVSVKLMNNDNQEFIYEFSFDNEMTALSILIRQIIGAPRLLLFDGHREIDKIQQIHIEVRKNIYEEYGDVNSLSFDWKTSSISIDCKSHQFKHSSNSQSEYVDGKMIHQLQKDINFHIGDTLYDLDIFTLGESNQFDKCPARGGIVTVRIKWTHKEDTHYIGNLTDRYIPSWYKSLIGFMSVYIDDRLLQEFLPSTKESDKKIYTYCSVYIFKFDKEFYYRTDRNDIREGDLVKVPFGSNNEVRSGRVESVTYHTCSNVPYDLYRTKFIIDKDTDFLCD